MKSLFYFVGFISLAFSARLMTTPIDDGGLYRLENQEDGSFLFASDPGTQGQLGKVTSGEYTGNPGQKWIFKADPEGKDIYTIYPQANENNFVSVDKKYLLIKVGHGKRLLRNTKTGLCVQSYGRGRPVQEKDCGRDNPKQRWNVQPTST